MTGLRDKGTTQMRQDPAMASAGTGRKTVFVKTYGCQMNVYDSERMTDILAREGYDGAEGPEEADFVLLNTCHIREKAAEKIYSEIGRLRRLKAERRSKGQDMIIGVAGCVAQAEGLEIIRRAPDVDLVIGPQTYHRLPDTIRRVKRGEKVVETEFAIDEKFDTMPAARPDAIRQRGFSAFLTVQEGCDKFCSFCVVPYTRGAEVSRTVSQIVAEARRLTQAGVREITLLGQNVNAWRSQGPDGHSWVLGTLLRHLAAEVEGLARLRYTTSHPRDMDDDLIAAHRDLEMLMPYLHLPVQSGSDRILKAMNRRHSRADYLRLIERIRAANPDIALSGDFIVGFPGETEEDFRDTMRLVEAVGYAQAFSFKYSPRPGTPAAELTKQVDEDVKSDRLTRLQALLRAQQNAFSKACVGRHIDLLLEKRGRKAGQIVGRSPWLQPVVIDAEPSQIGDIVPVRIMGAGSNSLFGRLEP